MLTSAVQTKLSHDMENPISGRVNEAISDYTTYVSDNGNIEFEARYGRFSKKLSNNNSKSKGIKFEPGVSVAAFSRVEEFAIRQRFELIENSINTIQSMNYETGRIRKVTTKSIIQPIQESVKWEFKSNIRNIDIPEYGIRIAVNREQPIDPYNSIIVDFTRETTRKSYSYTGIGRFDLTIVKVQKDSTDSTLGQSKVDEDIIYEIEFEMYKEVVRSDEQRQRYQDMVQQIYLLINDTNLIYDVYTKERFIQVFNRLLNSNQKFGIDKSKITQARPIKYKDLVWGGLVGNKNTNYRIAHKTDGIRKFLVFMDRDIWLLSSSGDLNRIHHSVNSQLDRTILDCELIPYQNRIVPNGAPKVRYWLFMLDALFVQGTDVRQNDHDFRLRKAQPIVNLFKENNLIIINSKSFVSVDTPIKLFDAVETFESSLPRLSYKTDGYVFVPDKVPYITYQKNDSGRAKINNPDQLPLSDRCLKRIPEIVKWKPITQITIDLMVSKPESPTDKIRLLTSDKTLTKLANGRTAVTWDMVDFVGDTLNPFDINMLRNNEVLEKAVTGNVVEFSWDIENKFMYAKTIRHDKRFPNRLEIALDNWNDLNNPIEIDVLKGKTIRLMRKYHNRVKRGLFNKYGSGKKNGTILDIGSGRGGDIYTMNSKFSRMLLIEPSSSNITELISRMNKGNVGTRVLILPDPSEKATIISLLSEKQLNDMQNSVIFLDSIDDLDYISRPDDKALIVQTGGEYTDIITSATNKFLRGPADVVSMMFSLSFFWESPQILDALASTIQKNSKPDAVYIFTTIDGNAVEQVFRPLLGGTPINFINDIQDLSNPIKMEYIDNSLTGERPKIRINIENTIVGTGLDALDDQIEWLVRITDLETRLAPFGFTKIMYHRLEDEYLLTPQEERFTKLMYAGAFQRNSPTNHISQPPVSSQNIISKTVSGSIHESSLFIQPLDKMKVFSTNGQEVEILNLIPMIKSLMN